MKFAGRFLIFVSSSVAAVRAATSYDFIVVGAGQHPITPSWRRLTYDAP